jgi:sigma-E factor negative regulatory protein RseC
MPEPEIISHPGTVEKIENGHIYIKIMAQSACSACHAKGACTVADMEEKVVEIESPDDRVLHSGDKVMISMRRRTGNLAVFLGYILPFLILFTCLVTMILITGKEGLSALIASAALIAYYIIIYLFRIRISSMFTFTLD